MSAGRRLTAASAADVVVPLVLAALGVLGFATAFGGWGYLLAGLGGLAVGAGAGLLGRRLPLLPAVLVGVLAYFAFGSALAMPDAALWLVVPTPETLAGLVLGAVWGWADLVTLRAPVEAPAYLTVVPYVAGWLVGLVTALLATRWLPGRSTAPRRALLLVGPVLLLLAAVLIGTQDSVHGALRGTLFAAVALVWLGWRRRDPSAPDAATDAAGSRSSARHAVQSPVNPAPMTTRSASAASASGARAAGASSRSSQYGRGAASRRAPAAASVAVLTRVPVPRRVRSRRRRRRGRRASGWTRRSRRCARAARCRRAGAAPCPGTPPG